MPLSSTESTRARRTQVLQIMGGRCVHCGFDDPRALHIDHIFGGGKIERTRMQQRWPEIKIRRMEKKGEPWNLEYQLLCANCNCIKKIENHESYVSNDPTSKKTIQQKKRKQLRKERARELLGGSFCVICGESDPRVLQFDHIEGGGGKDKRKRKKEGKGHMNFSIILRKHQRGIDVTEIYQVLCANCNWIKRFS